MVQMCAKIEMQGAPALGGWLYKDACQVPSVQGSTGAHCQLARQPWAYKFKQPLLAAYAAALFHSITAGRAAAAQQLGAPAPQLSRFDLFHGHIFIAAPTRSRDSNSPAGQQSTPRKLAQQRSQQHNASPHSHPNAAQPGNSSSSSSSSRSSQLPDVGILFHAAEYPTYEPIAFPIFLGNCQSNSSLAYHARAMDLRNILWYQDKLAVLDVGPSSPLHALLHQGTEPVRTVYEHDFGHAVADLLLLREPRRRRRSLKAAQQLQARRWHRLLQSQQAVAACEEDVTGVFVSY